MGKENADSSNNIQLQGASSKLLVAATSPNQGPVVREKTKRTPLDDKNPNEPNKRAVLKDITNIKKERAHVTDAKVEVLSNSGGGSLPVRTCRSLGTNDASYSFIPKISLRLPPRPFGTGEVHKRLVTEACVSDSFAVERSCVGASSTVVSSSSKYVDIDSDDKDPLLCSLYAPDIHYNLRVAELYRRPNPDFMERTQRDVTPTMRGVLVDWLKEVSEEYSFVPDTLYLTVYLIDWFLHGNYVEKQKLQLLGVTCLLIASRFIRAGQASYTNPSLELEFLANYLTELTLIEYNFLKYLPSLIAASAVFLAKWTLNQSRHPWNPTLEHYTTYKSSDLKTSAHALQDLQRNGNDCSLNSIRMKYRQDKFKSVALYNSANLPDKLFISE